MAWLAGAVLQRFDTMVKAVHEAVSRAQRNKVRALHRLIPNKDGA
jgi:hypothetical protein